MVQMLSKKLRQFIEMPFYDKINSLVIVVYRIKALVLYRRVFGAFGSRSYIEKPQFISNPRFMYLGSNVSVRKGARLECVCDPFGRVPRLSIGSNVNIEQDVHIICHSRIVIGNDVSVTGRCAIVDVTHPYQAAKGRKIGELILDEDSFVEIGDGAFLGFACVVLPNVRIGRYAVIGANSVVTRDVPDYCVAAGAPAKMIKRYSQAPEV